ncbi:MAG: chlorite dismutase [Cellvibrionaceae bacterium]|jgi:chlorite dismutase
MIKDKSEVKIKTVDLSERGKDAEGNPTLLNRRLYMQMLAFGDCQETAPLAAALQAADIQGVLYAEASDPHGVGLMTFSEDPAYFIDVVRPVLNQTPFRELTPKPEFSMLGRTYSIGYEQNLEFVLTKKPAERVTNPKWPWAVWYPLKRKGSFHALSRDEQMNILREHGTIGRSYGESGHGLDVRLACHGLDKNDNDFITGLVGDNLTGLSKIVQRMRKTKQTSTYLESLGPFFVGKVIWQALLR